MFLCRSSQSVWPRWCVNVCASFCVVLHQTLRGEGSKRVSGRGRVKALLRDQQVNRAAHTDGFKERQ